MKEKNWIVLNQVTGKQAKHLDGTLTPKLENPSQCFRYIENRLGNSPIFIPYKYK